MTNNHSQNHTDLLQEIFISPSGTMKASIEGDVAATCDPDAGCNGKCKGISRVEPDNYPEHFFG